MKIPQGETAFLDASQHLYNSSCLSVPPSLRPSVPPSLRPSVPPSPPLPSSPPSPSPALPGPRSTVHVEDGWMVGAPLALDSVQLVRVPHGAQVLRTPLHNTPPPRPP